MFFKPGKNIHRHDFRIHSQNALAFWSKRRDLMDQKYFLGTLRRCPGCGAYRFHVPGLREVEVTRC